MAEFKYGRLFTFRDVVRLLNAITHEAPDEHLDFEALVAQAVRDGDGEPLTFPADEPLFLLRGQDRFAPDGVSGYFDALQAAVDEEGDWLVGAAHRDAVADAGNALDRWQMEHPERVKVPD